MDVPLQQSLYDMTDAEYCSHIESMGHELRRSPTGDVDDFVLDFETHNGPGCIRCGNSWCIHCRNAVEACSPPNMPRRLHQAQEQEDHSAL